MVAVEIVEGPRISTSTLVLLLPLRHAVLQDIPKGRDREEIAG